MITYNTAVSNFKKKYPDKRIGGCYDMDEWYLISVSDQNDYDAAFYAVNKNNGDVKTYSPLADLANFKKAMKHQIQ